VIDKEGRYCGPLLGIGLDLSWVQDREIKERNARGFLDD
jgi:hypothetical protein